MFTFYFLALRSLHSSKGHKTYAQITFVQLTHEKVSLFYDWEVLEQSIDRRKKMSVKRG